VRIRKVAPDRRSETKAITTENQPPAPDHRQQQSRDQFIRNSFIIPRQSRNDPQKGRVAKATGSGQPEQECSNPMAKMQRSQMRCIKVRVAAFEIVASPELAGKGFRMTGLGMVRNATQQRRKSF